MTEPRSAFDLKRLWSRPICRHRSQNTLSLLRQNSDYHVITGTAFVEIIRYAREESSDIIVVGAHGAQFIKDLLLGTTLKKQCAKEIVGYGSSNGRFVLRIAAYWWQPISRSIRASAEARIYVWRAARNIISFTPTRDVRNSFRGRVSQSRRSCIIVISWHARVGNNEIFIHGLGLGGNP